MDASMLQRVEQLAEEIAGEAQTQEDLNGLLRLMMKSALQRMLDTELDVHLGRRAALRYVTDKDSRAVAADLNKIYNAATLSEAESALENFSQTWDEKYPTIAKSWREKWPDIITLFDFLWPIRKAISTTNAIESVNSVIRKLTRNRKIDPNEESALKIIDMAINEASKKWLSAESRMETGTQPLRHPVRESTARITRKTHVPISR